MDFKAVLVVASIMSSSAIHGTADGPEFWKAQGIPVNKSIKIYERPSTKSRPLDDIYKGTEYIENLGVTSPKRISDNSNPVWCKVKVTTNVGWVKCKYLEEGPYLSLNKYTCPDYLGVDPKQKLLTKAPGWETDWIPHRYRFLIEGVYISDGHPLKLGGPMKLPKDKRGRIVWARSKGDKGDYYITCDYEDTSLTLYKKLPANIKKCTMKYHQHAEPQYTVKCN
jgi:hypothetical protein